MSDRRIPIHSQIAEVDRELAMRRDVYARRVADRKMRQSEADLLIERLQAVRETLVFCSLHEADIREYIRLKRDAE